MDYKVINNKFKAFMFSEEDNLLYFFNGFNYELLSINELEKLKNLSQSNIDSYNSYVENTEYLNKQKDIENTEWLNTLSIKTSKTKTTIRGIIYILKCERTNLYKIGLTSGKMKSRLKSLKTANPSITLFKYYEDIDDIYYEEKFFHDMFKKKRVDGEWFKLKNKDLNTIDLILNTSF